MIRVNFGTGSGDILTQYPTAEVCRNRPPIPQPVTGIMAEYRPKLCAFCGKPLPSSGNFCGECGKPIM